MKLISLLFFLGSLLSVTQALSQELANQATISAKPTVSNLAEALESAWQRHPQAAALDARDAEAKAEAEWAAKLTPEPGSMSVSSRNDRLNRNSGQQEYEVEYATPLWLPGQRAAHQDKAKSLLNEAAAKRAALRWQLAGEVREAWWALASARNAKALATHRLDNIRALELDVQRRFKAGELSRIDSNLGMTEKHTAESELIEAQASLLQAEQAFYNLTGTSVPIAMPEESHPLQLSAMPETHPQLIAALSVANTMRAHLKVVENTQRAAPELALRIVRERNAIDVSYANSIGVRLRIPFSSGPQKHRDSAAAQAEALEADATVLQVRARIQSEIDRLQQMQQPLERQITIAQESHALAMNNLRLAENAFRLGEYDLTALLRIRAAAFQAESLLERQRLARAVLISRLHQASGVLP